MAVLRGSFLKIYWLIELFFRPQFITGMSVRQDSTVLGFLLGKAQAQTMLYYIYFFPGSPYAFRDRDYLVAGFSRHLCCRGQWNSRECERKEPKIWGGMPKNNAHTLSMIMWLTDVCLHYKWHIMTVMKPCTNASAYHWTKWAHLQSYKMSQWL